MESFLFLYCSAKPNRKYLVIKYFQYIKPVFCHAKPSQSQVNTLVIEARPLLFVFPNIVFLHDNILA